MTISYQVSFDYAMGVFITAAATFLRSIGDVSLMLWTAFLLSMTLLYLLGGTKK